MVMYAGIDVQLYRSCPDSAACKSQERKRERCSHMSIRPAWPMRTIHCTCLNQLKDSCQTIRNVTMAYPHLDDHLKTSERILSVCHTHEDAALHLRQLSDECMSPQQISLCVPHNWAHGSCHFKKKLEKEVVSFIHKPARSIC